jgi:hypothetical protein
MLVVTTLLDPEQASKEELACLYPMQFPGIELVTAPTASSLDFRSDATNATRSLENHEPR